MKHLVAHPPLSRKMMTEVDSARSRTVRVVRSQDTGPEVTVRRIAHKLGDRFRLHRKDLPGTPDLVFPRFRKVIFVHGCFWYGHDCSRGSRVPQMNRDYWAGKLERNKARDAKALSDLRSMGWQAQTLWKCEIRKPANKRFCHFLSPKMPILRPRVPLPIKLLYRFVGLGRFSRSLRLVRVRVQMTS